MEPLNASDIFAIQNLQALCEKSCNGDTRKSTEQYNINYTANPCCDPSCTPSRVMNGIFGLEMMSKRHENMAFCGYEICKDENDGLWMLINHMPQGALIGSLQRSTRQLLVNNALPFRDILLQELIDIARENALKGIVITSALNHLKVRKEEITMERGCQIIDDVATRNGFSYIPGGNLALRF